MNRCTCGDPTHCGCQAQPAAPAQAEARQVLDVGDWVRLLEPYARGRDYTGTVTFRNDRACFVQFNNSSCWPSKMWETRCLERIECGLQPSDWLEA